MCGIIAAFNKKQENKETVNEWVLNQFEDQRKRGTEGFGIISINEDGQYIIARATEGYKFMWDIHMNQSTMLLVHHRTPTSTPNLIKQTHPMVVSNGSLQKNYIVVHNGVVYNASEVKKKHEELGFLYETEMEGNVGEKKFNDSEAFAIELARFIEGQTNEIDIRGSVAFVALQVDKKTKKVEQLYFGRNEANPLKIAKSREILKLSSEGPGNEVKPFNLYFCELDGEMKLRHRKMTFTKIPTKVGFDTSDYYSRFNPKTGKTEYNSRYDYDYDEPRHGTTLLPAKTAKDDKFVSSRDKIVNKIDVDDEIEEINPKDDYPSESEYLQTLLEPLIQEIDETVENFIEDLSYNGEGTLCGSYAKEIYDVLKKMKKVSLDFMIGQPSDIRRKTLKDVGIEVGSEIEEKQEINGWID